MMSNKAKQTFAEEAMRTVYEEEIWYMVEQMFDNDWAAAYDYIVQGDDRLGVIFPDPDTDAELIAATKENNPDFDADPVRVSWDFDTLPQNTALEVVFGICKSAARVALKNELTMEDLL